MVIYPESFSVKPNTESTVNFRNLFNTTSQTAVNKNLTLITGNYVFCSKNAEERELYISDTIAADEYEKGEKPNIRRCAVVLENVRNMEIDCCDSNFIMDGKMTHLVFRNCENIKLKNLNIETVNPDVHKITVLKSSTFYVSFKVDETSRFVEENGSYYWCGTDYKMSITDFKNNMRFPVASADNYSHLSRGAHPLHGVASIKPISERVFNARFITPKDFAPGDTFYIYPPKRCQVGVFIDSCRNITLENVSQSFNNGFGVVAQNSENITLDRIKCVPNSNYEADLCSLSDFLRFVMCRGKIRVLDSEFDGTGGNGCNLHGIHFKITKIDKNRITVRFCNDRAYGFPCIREGDMIAFIDPRTLIEVGSTKIIHATLRDEYYYDLEVATYDVPLAVGGFVEDISACPDFEFSGNTLNKIVKSGVRCNTRGRIRIENNRLLNTGEQGIVISGDVSNKYESGCVLNGVIRGNAFMNCEKSAILIKPENRKYSGPVHKNIRIEDNLFIINNITALDASSCSDIEMQHNVYKGRALNGRWVIARNTENLVTDCPK